LVLEAFRPNTPQGYEKSYLFVSTLFPILQVVGPPLPQEKARIGAKHVINYRLFQYDPKGKETPNKKSHINHTPLTTLTRTSLTPPNLSLAQGVKTKRRGQARRRVASVVRLVG